MENPKHAQIAEAFNKYLQTQDKSVIEKFSAKEIEVTLITYYGYKDKPFYKAMEDRSKELRQQAEVANKQKKEFANQRQPLLNVNISKPRSKKPITMLLILGLVVICIMFYLRNIEKFNNQALHIDKSAIFKTNISGEWKLINTLESFSGEDSVSEYQLFLQQNQSNVTGEGRKYKQNGKELSEDAGCLISFQGTIEDMTLTAVFRQAGANETVNGTFALAISFDGNLLQGIFTDELNGTQGVSVAERIE